VAPANTAARPTWPIFFSRLVGIRPIIFFEIWRYLALEPDPKVNVRKSDCEETVAETRGNGEVAPLGDVPWQQQTAAGFVQVEHCSRSPVR